jgi:hypothetical protein
MGGRSKVSIFDDSRPHPTLNIDGLSSFSRTGEKLVSNSAVRQTRRPPGTQSPEGQDVTGRFGWRLDGQRLPEVEVNGLPGFDPERRDAETQLLHLVVKEMKQN